MKALLTVALFLVLATTGIGQVRTITGRIIDSSTKKGIRNANVIVEGTSSGTTSNSHGFFQLDVAAGYSLEISHLSYKSGTIKIPEENNFSIVLSAEIYDLAPLSINGDPFLIDTPEHWASFDSGWGAFYEQFKELLMSDAEISKHTFHGEVYFKITEEGKISSISYLPDSDMQKSRLIDKLAALNEWTPAMQNGTFASQSFKMIVHNVSEKIFDSVDESARPANGYRSLYANLQRSIGYPSDARRAGIEGEVLLQFVIDFDGSLRDLQVTQGIGAGCDREVLKVVGNSPDAWIPAKVDGLPVRQQVTIPFVFALGIKPKQNDRAGSNFEDANNLPPISIVAIGVERTTVISRSGGPPGGSRSGGGSRSRGGSGRQGGSFSNPPSRTLTAQNLSPEFPGGPARMANFIKKNRIAITEPLPPNRYDNSVIMQFTVDIGGNINNLSVVKSLGKVFDEEAMRIFATMPAWKPATSRGTIIEKSTVSSVTFGDVSKKQLEVASMLYNKGIEYFNASKFVEAEVEFTKAIDKNPTHLDYYYNRGIVRIELEKIAEACSDLKYIMGKDQMALELFKENCK